MMTAGPPAPRSEADADSSHTGWRHPILALLITLVRIYQAARHGRPSSCRYVPSCSVYAIEALERHGAWHGSWLTARRLGRCHPWGGYGADPVPE
jgi:uncharacterized protein